MQGEKRRFIHGGESIQYRNGLGCFGDEGQGIGPVSYTHLDVYKRQGLALPCGFDDLNLPIGMQLIGPAFSDRMLLGVGESYQAVTDFHTRFPREEA